MSLTEANRKAMRVKRTAMPMMAEGMMRAAMKHPSIPAELRFDADWESVDVRWSYSMHTKGLKTYSFEIKLLGSDDIVEGYAEVSKNPDYPERGAPGIPGTCRCRIQYSRTEWSFRFQIVDNHIIAIPAE